MKLIFFLSLLQVGLVLGANPISTPIIDGDVEVEVRRFAQIPTFNGRPSRVNAIVSRGFNLYICTETSGSRVYRVNRFGSVSLWFDVAAAVPQATNRAVDTTNFMHGGLRSMAFHPRYPRNGLFYTSYMETKPSDPENFEYLSDVPNPIAADSVVIEWKFDFSAGQVDVMSYRQVLRIGMPVYDHPIKQIMFSGRFLYVCHGDGSVQSATAGGGQRDDALGKILRINPLQSGSQSYTVPSSNPFVNNPNFRSEIWALGFRNPHHLCFSNQRELISVDTGRDNVEEVNIVVKGGNYGWSDREGTFVHKPFGGIINGIDPLPANDAQFGYRYPVAQVGHEGPVGAGFVGQAIAGGCPVQNGSPLDGLYFYADFPVSGKLYYSSLSDMRAATVTGSPSQLSQASTSQAKILFDDDDNPSTPPIQLATLGDVVRSEPGQGNANRADIRFGRGRLGELYWSSKKTGMIYLMTNSLPSASARQLELSQLNSSRFYRDSEV